MLQGISNRYSMSASWHTAVVPKKAIPSLSCFQMGWPKGFCTSIFGPICSSCFDPRLLQKPHRSGEHGCTPMEFPITLGVGHCLIKSTWYMLSCTLVFKMAYTTALNHPSFTSDPLPSLCMAEIKVGKENPNSSKRANWSKQK